jgi:ABC-type xylose transport system substrate-binding protein
VIKVGGCIAGLIAVNLDISGLESNAKSLKRSVCETRTKTVTKESNIDGINGDIGAINNSITILMAKEKY